MTKTELIKEQCKQLNLTALSTHLESVVAQAEKNQTSYWELIKMLMEKEISSRKEKDLVRRTQQARLPLSYNLDLYDFTVSNGLDKQQLNQLLHQKQSLES